MKIFLLKKSSLVVEFTLTLLLSVSVNASAAVVANKSVDKVLSPDFSTDVIDMNEQKLFANYWLNKLADGNNVLMTQAGIKKQNKMLIDNGSYINDPLTMPATLTKQDLLTLINSISKVPSGARFYDDGRELNKQNYQYYLDSVNKVAIKDENKVKFALVVKRASLRTFPTLDKVYKKGGGRDLDRFQESGVFPGDAVAVLHHSADGHWLLVIGTSL